LLPGEAHENAIKEAETDATKRALSTFGNLFGLALYDKEQQGVQPLRSKSKNAPVVWTLLSTKGEKLEQFDDPIVYCSEARQHIESFSNVNELSMFWKYNKNTIKTLRIQLPLLKAESGQHYSEILETLYVTCFKNFSYRGAQKKVELRQPKLGSKKEQSDTTEGQDTNPQSGDTSEVAQPENLILEKGPRRIRDKEHLKFIASNNCLICGRFPTQAHHIQYAQARALSRKVSDEWTVPLCALHHRALHDHGNEEKWWAENGIEPVEEAIGLWQLSHHLDSAG